MRYEFAPEFDGEFYRKKYESEIGAEDPFSHFSRIGKARGLMGSHLADGDTFVKALGDLPFANAIELGPGIRPQLKGNGEICYFDVRSKAEFFEYARAKGEKNPQKLPEIRYVDNGGRLTGIPEKFDLVFSSHVIEHAYDIIQHLQDVASILRPGGLYCLLVPDKRYTFDYFKPLSALTDMVARHFMSIAYHPLSVYMTDCLNVHNDPQEHWRNEHGKADAAADDFARACDRFRKQEGRDPGLHSWIFTDDSFREILFSLYGKGIMSLKPLRVYNTILNANQFCAVLQKP